jgi:hypothetical protein
MRDAGSPSADASTRAEAGTNDAGQKGKACSGLAVSCFAYVGICSSQAGCYDDGTQDCGGQARQCSTFTTEATCVHQEVCHWD